jgi:hypothetical protein
LEFDIAADKWARDNEHSELVAEWIKSREGEQKRLWEVYQGDMRKYEVTLEEYNSLIDVEARVNRKIEEWQEKNAKQAAKQAAKQDTRDEHETASSSSSISDLYQSEGASDEE